MQRFIIVIDSIYLLQYSTAKLIWTFFCVAVLLLLTGCIRPLSKSGPISIWKVSVKFYIPGRNEFIWLQERNGSHVEHVLWWNSLRFLEIKVLRNGVNLAVLWCIVINIWGINMIMNWWMLKKQKFIHP